MCINELELCAREGATAGANRLNPQGRRARRGWAVDPERLVFLRVLAELELEVEALLVDGYITCGPRIRDQRGHVDDLGNLVATGSGVIGPPGGIRLFLRATWRPTVDGEGATGVGETVAPEIDVRAREVRIHLAARPSRLADVVDPHVAGVGIAPGGRVRRRGLHHSCERHEPSKPDRQDRKPQSDRTRSRCECEARADSVFAFLVMPLLLSTSVRNRSEAMVIKTRQTVQLSQC